MREVNLSSLEVNSITSQEYYSQDGELLISKDVTITQKHLEALQRRNIYTVYTKDSEEDELQQLLSKEYKLDELDLQESPDETSNFEEEPPKALDLPEFKNIKSGQEGLEQLMMSKKAADVDNTLRKGALPDRPVGPALSDKATDMTPSQRTAEYKNEVSNSYTGAVQSVRNILRSVADGHNIDGSQIRQIVSTFVKKFITDKNILLNISNTKPVDKDYLYNHSLNVCLIAINIAASVGFSEEQVVEIGMGALLHDIGMLLIPFSIRNKKGKFNQDEWFEVQKHPILGLHLLECITRLPHSVPIVAYQSHERENGRGYPKRRSKRLIHNYAKIVQIADVFEALSSPRPYRDPHIPYKAMEFSIKMTKQGLISGEFVRAFLMYASLFPVGSLIELSTRQVSKVVQANGASFAKPQISVLTDEHGNLLPPGEIYQEDLSKNTAIQIVKAHPLDHLADVNIMDGF
ncbi:MAG: HD domain-containing protein [Chitinivibrionales bacterium]|nr:HD domain-containing protein [Chitinivibrionales bacterium]